MFRNFGRVGFSSIVLSLMLAGAASADGWQIVQSSGPVWFGSDTAQLVSLGSTPDLPNGSTVVTGDGGRAMLVRGEQTMLVGPNAVITLPQEEGAGMTTVLQRSGEVSFDVDRQKVQHFAVETPYLAAVVKGTHFVVSVDGENAAVSVDRGLVAVTDLATGEEVDTAAGQNARVRRNGGNLEIAGTGLLPVISQGTPRSSLVAPLSANDLRGMQSGAAKSNGSVQALNNVDTGVAVAGTAVGAGTDDNDGGSSGGIDTADNSPAAIDTDVANIDVSGATAAPAQNVAMSFGDNSGYRRPAKPQESVSPLTFVMGAAFLALAAFGLAYIRSKVAR